MTDQTPAPEQPAPTLVEAVPGSPLADQLARYPDLKARAAQAKADYEACTSAIKVLAYEAAFAIDPTTERISIHDPAGIAPPLTESWSPGSERVDVKALRRDHEGSDFLRAYMTTSEGSWGLRASGGRS